MTNGERREALARAREKALQYAEAADRYRLVDFDGDGPRVADSTLTRREHLMRLAMMWASVADALKVGAADGPDAVAGAAVHTEYGTIER